MKYKEGVSTEPLEVIEGNECFGEATLARSRFRRLFNEIHVDASHASLYRLTSGMSEGAGFPTLSDAIATAVAVRTLEKDLYSLLPGPYYMDPPDGGDVPLFEQLRRMSEDAAKWRNRKTLTADEITAHFAEHRDGVTTLDELQGLLTHKVQG